MQNESNPEESPSPFNAQDGILTILESGTYIITPPTSERLAETIRERYLKAAHLIDSWLSEDSDYDERVYAQLEKEQES